MPGSRLPCCCLQLHKGSIQCACVPGACCCCHSASQVISAMVDGDYMSLVKTRPVGQWRETLAVLATYTGESC